MHISWEEMEMGHCFHCSPGKHPGNPVYMYSTGGLAEYCVVPANALSILPDSLPYSESADVLYLLLMVLWPMRLKCALGILLLLLELEICFQRAKAFGAPDIIAVDVLDEKLQKAKPFGATPIEITGGKGVDIAVEALGKPHTFPQCTESMKDGGKAVMIGLEHAGAAGGEVDINRIVHRKIKVIGSYGGRARQDLPK
ncbi:putative Alcohol dehydrogenase [Quillaja saponaria]|uniref:Alcohol dehydrogenase n=1 Tax=Quillaja saponaria TaxID=32244 RepID=A0AAD7LF79_QUISA|nr:putative Alcohol dehydrogenase [Quillaja saponaria]